MLMNLTYELLTFCIDVKDKGRDCLLWLNSLTCSFLPLGWQAMLKCLVWNDIQGVNYQFDPVILKLVIVSINILK